MERIREYVIDAILNNIKDNIKLYINFNDNYFNDLKALVETINEEESYLKYFIDNKEPLMIITESTLTDISSVARIMRNIVSLPQCR